MIRRFLSLPQGERDVIYEQESSSAAAAAVQQQHCADRLALLGNDALVSARKTHTQSTAHKAKAITAPARY